jgi:hypothetical protein
MFLLPLGKYMGLNKDAEEKITASWLIVINGSYDLNDRVRMKLKSFAG